MSKDRKLMRLLELKFQSAEERLTKARDTCATIHAQIEAVKARRNLQPADPSEQLAYERHIGWLDQKGRELSIMAAQAAVEFNQAQDNLRVQFGRKVAFAKAMELKASKNDRQKNRQLS